MPHMYNDAEVEAQYGNMVRIVADTGNGDGFTARRPTKDSVVHHMAQLATICSTALHIGL